MYVAQEQTYQTTSASFPLNKKYTQGLSKKIAGVEK